MKNKYIIDGETPIYGRIENDRWELYYGDNDRTVVSGFNNDGKVEIFKALGIPFYDTRNIIEEDLYKSVDIPMIALDGIKKTVNEFTEIPFMGQQYDTLENVFTLYGNAGADIYNITLPLITYDKENRLRQVADTKKLSNASRNSEWDEVVRLIDEGYCNIDVVSGKDNETPLHLAIKSALYSMPEASETAIKKLIEAGADIEWKTASNHTPMSRSCYFGRNDTIQTLHDAGAKMPDNAMLTILHHSSLDIENRKQTMKLLTELGSNVNYITGRNGTGAKEESLLMLVTKTDYDKLKVIPLLVDSGVDITYVNPDGNSAYKIALQRGGEECPAIKYFDNILLKRDSEIFYSITDKNRQEITEAITKGSLRMIGGGENKSGESYYTMEDYQPILKEGLIHEGHIIPVDKKGLEVVQKLKNDAYSNAFDEQLSILGDNFGINSIGFAVDFTGTDWKKGYEGVSAIVAHLKEVTKELDVPEKELFSDFNEIGLSLKENVSLTGYKDGNEIELTRLFGLTAAAEKANTLAVENKTDREPVSKKREGKVTSRKL